VTRLVLEAPAPLLPQPPTGRRGPTAEIAACLRCTDQWGVARSGRSGRDVRPTRAGGAQHRGGRSSAEL